MTSRAFDILRGTLGGSGSKTRSLPSQWSKPPRPSRATTIPAETLAADGELTRRHDAYRAGLAGPALAPPPPAAPRPQAVTRVTLHWDEGTSSVFYPPAVT